MRLYLGVAARGSFSVDDFLTLLTWDKSVSYLKQVGDFAFVSASAFFCHKVLLLGYHREYGRVSSSATPRNSLQSASCLFGCFLSTHSVSVLRLCLDSYARFLLEGS